ncbi:uncharacterized protein G2W53_030934 [Senna tora]|uniref:Uncharacterized protein n=1 Tax=Senna tora TaxID=362788 RepID=A0A834WB94_9FABA|nr:uncharacterized protein G2W53_030934 [Senna tora]
MVSFQKVLAQGATPAANLPAEFEASSKKRKWEDPLAEQFLNDQSKAEKRQPIFDIELHLETPFPSDHKWQQYLSFQSGQIHLCNTNTRMNGNKAAEDPKRSQMSLELDLELNLTCESLRKKEGGSSYDTNEKQNNSTTSGSLSEQDLFNESSSPSWLPSSDQGDHKEMVATVCMRCHMLVMLCKSSPACPNCKFMHPPDQKPSTFLKRRCSLLC